MKNEILFAFCADPATCVVLNAADGKILATLPIGDGVDGAEFNPDTMEAFSSQGDGTLTVIKENSPTSFAVEQTVKTPRGEVLHAGQQDRPDLPHLDQAHAPAPATQPAAQPGGAAPAGRRGGGRGGATVPGSLPSPLWGSVNLIRTATITVSLCRGHRRAA